MRPVDSMRLDSPAAQRELAYLQMVKVGEARLGSLFPALEIDVVWTCEAVSEAQWVFKGTFLGQFFLRAIIQLTTDVILNQKALALYVEVEK